MYCKKIHLLSLALTEENTPESSLVSIVVFHAVQKHALPITMPTDVLTGEVYRKYGLLVDIAFSETIYDCDMNTTAMSKLIRFLEPFVKIPSEIGNEEPFTESPPEIENTENDKVSTVVKYRKVNKIMEIPVPNETRIQIYDAHKSDLSRKFIAAFHDFVNSLSCKSVLLNVDSHADINKEWPMFVICYNYSRIGADVEETINTLPGKNKVDYSTICIVVFHAVQRHAIPKTMPTDLLTDDVYRQFGPLVDIAFSETIYDCDMNTTARSKLMRFLKMMSTQSHMSDEIHERPTWFSFLKKNRTIKDVNNQLSLLERQFEKLTHRVAILEEENKTLKKELETIGKRIIVTRTSYQCQKTK